RASWPVTHTVLPMQEPPPTRAARRKKKGLTPTFKVVFTRQAPTIDGILSPAEWPKQKMAIKEDVHGKPAKPHSEAWLVHDGTYLYLAVRNEVNPAKPLISDARWGTNDAVEIAVQNPAKGKLAPIFVVRGYPDGKFECSTEAGAPEPEASALQVVVEYRAKVVDPAHWSAEFRIPWSALGVEPGKHARLPFNLTVRKMASSLWLMWVGPEAHSWQVDQAGVILLEKQPK
ncbi:MAG: hypothetical protein KAI66_08735, partial [Lentisphaeria bacterium]|nr:hypothetical protein [Lentisphaeria bacterium]